MVAHVLAVPNRACKVLTAIEESNFSVTVSVQLRVRSITFDESKHKLDLCHSCWKRPVPLLMSSVNVKYVGDTSP